MLSLRRRSGEIIPALLGLARLVGIACSVGAAGAAHGERADWERWVPALGVSGGVTLQRTEAGVASPQRDEAVDSGSNNVFAQLGLDLELMTPRLLDAPANPRLFVHGGFAVSFDSEHFTAREGIPGPLAFPDVAFEPPVGGIQRQGSATSAQSDGLDWSLGAGLAFGFEALERALRVRSSLEYRREGVQVFSRVADAESIDDDGSCPCRSAFLLHSVRESYDSLGVGLEIAFDAARVGRLLSAVFFGAQALAVLGDRTTNFGVTGSFDDGSPLSANSSYTRERWNYRGHFGLRFRWLPE